MPSLTTYKLLKQEHDARRGEFKTVHGTVQTPAFQNVATAGAIKGGLSAQDLKDIGAQVMLCNTYHLHLRPGDKLVADIEELNARKATIKAKAAVAKTQSKVNEMTSAGDRAEGARSAFDRMEAKADEMLDRANAVAELSEKPADPTEELAKKYAAAGAEAAVDDDLARLKKEMGLE